MGPEVRELEERLEAWSAYYENVHGFIRSVVRVDPSRALVLSQVVLSFGIPFALIPLVRLTANTSLMGGDTNHRVTTALGWTVAGVISLLNVVLIYLTLTG